MYKTTRGAQLPEYMDYSPRDEDYMAGIQLENNISRPQYRVFSMNHRNQTTRSRSETSFSDNISLTPSASRSATQDLAEFLRTSSPEDYKRFLGSSSSEDLTSPAVSQKRSFRFLKPSVPRSSSARSSTTSIAPPLPNKNVVSKITSRGKPYLQINVDYDQNHLRSHTTITASRQASCSSETSSDRYQRNSTVTNNSTGADSGISFPASYTGERSNMSPPLSRGAQESRASLDTATMGRYQQFLDSRFDQKDSRDSAEAKAYSSPSDIVSAGMAELRAFQEFQRLQGMKTPPRTPECSSIPRTSSDFLSLRSPPRHRSQPNSARLVRAESREVSVVSDLFDDITDTEFEGTAGPHGQRKKSRKTPPRPGPPPKRSLPSLPEGHDDSTTKSPGESHETLHVCHSQISLTSTNVSACSHLDDAQSIRSNRKSREERVKARKAKDLSKHLQLMEEKKSEGKPVGDSESVISGTDSSTRPPSSVCGDLGEMGQLTPRRSGSGRRSSSDKSSRNSSIAVVLSENLDLSVNSLPRNHLPENTQTLAICAQSPGLASLGNENPHSPTPTQTACSGREMELEARMLAIERKNKLLEQALMAVIRSAMRGQAQRRTELLKANVLEELLDAIDLGEFPAAFAAGDQVNWLQKRWISNIVLAHGVFFWLSSHSVSHPCNIGVHFVWLFSSM